MRSSEQEIKKQPARGWDRLCHDGGCAAAGGSFTAGFGGRSIKTTQDTGSAALLGGGGESLRRCQAPRGLRTYAGCSVFHGARKQSLPLDMDQYMIILR